MDAATAEGVGTDACCDVCGYSRRGLPPEALCPECGEPPPAVAGGAAVGAVAYAAATRGELAWLRGVACGLFLLLVCSFWALQVTLVMRLGPLSLAAVNVPGPKVHVAALLQRSIGGPPGPWGVAGTMAVLGVVAGVWLITNQRALRADSEPSLSLRSATRWIAVLSVGGMAGLLLSGSANYLPPQSDDSRTLLLYALLGAELPSNALLYLHLRNLARRLRNRRAEALLGTCAWAVPAVTLAALALIAIRWQPTPPPRRTWNVIAGVYGAIAVATGAAATAAVGQLFATAAAAGFAGAFAAGVARASSAGNLLRTANRSLERHAGRWCVVGGMVLWLLLLPFLLESVFSQEERQGLLGNVPALSFPGPKMSVVPVWDQYFSYRILQGSPVPFLNLLALWLMTVRIGERYEPAGLRWLRWITRAAATLALAVPMGLILGSQSRDPFPSPSYRTALSIAIGEIPSTVLIYWYLGELAWLTGRARLRRSLRLIACAVPAVAAAPLAAYVLSASHRPWRLSPVTALLGGINVAIALSLSMVAVFCAARPAWALLPPITTGADDSLTVTAAAE